MTRNQPSSHSSHLRVAGDYHHRNEDQRYASTSDNNSTSTHQSYTAQTSAYSCQSQSTSGQHHHADPSPHYSYHRTQDYSQDYPYYSESDSHMETPRPWSYVNANAIDLNSHPALNFNAAGHLPDTYYSSASSPGQPSNNARQNQLTASQLEAFNAASRPSSAIQRYEQQSQRAGPWDAVGYVRSNDRKR